MWLTEAPGDRLRNGLVVKTGVTFQGYLRDWSISSSPGPQWLALGSQALELKHSVLLSQGQSPSCCPMRNLR